MPAKNKAAQHDVSKKLAALLDLCVASLRKGHANLFCVVQILAGGLRGEAERIRLDGKEPQQSANQA